MSDTKTVFTPRTSAEIRARIEEVEAEDFFGTEQGDLIRALPYDEAREWLKPEVTADEWQPENDEASLRKAMAEYFSFAVDKATDHRGLSAGRSITHYRAWLWLLGDDELVAFADDSRNYPNYGVPILAAIAKKYGYDVPTGDEWLRMASGKSCEPTCDQGCSR